METFIILFGRKLTDSEMTKLLQTLINDGYFSLEDLRLEDNDNKTFSNFDELGSYISSSDNAKVEATVDLEDNSWKNKKLWLIQEKEVHDSAMEEYGYGLIFSGWKFLKTCILFSVEEYPDLEFLKKVSKHAHFSRMIAIAESIAGKKLSLAYGEE